MQRHAQLIGEHRVDPAIDIRCDRCHRAVQVLAGESLGGENLADFLALPRRIMGDLIVLGSPHLLANVLLGLGAQKIADRHRESIREKIRSAQNHNDPRRKLRPDHTRHHRKGRHHPIDRTINKISQVAVRGPLRQPLAHRLRCVLGLELFERGQH